MKIGLKKTKTSFGYNWKGRDGDPDGEVRLSDEQLTAEVPNKYADPIRATVMGQFSPIEIIDGKDEPAPKPGEETPSPPPPPVKPTGQDRRN